MHQVDRIELAGIASLAAAALLAGFLSVVRQSVRQGEIRRDEVSRQALASAECRRIPRRSDREACRARMPAQDSAVPKPPGR